MASILDGLFLKACMNGREDQARKALLKGADINATDKDGHTGLILASINRHHDVIILLSEKSADTDVKDRYGNSANDYIAGTDSYPHRRTPIKGEWQSLAQTEHKDRLSKIAMSIGATACISDDLLNKRKINSL